MSYLDLTIQEIHIALVNKQVTPLELTKEAIKRAKEDTNNCFEYICEKEALKKANKLKEPTSNLFWGIPYVLKDNFSTKDIPTTASSNILNGYIPLFDATVAVKLEEAGAILIGKTTLDELAMGGTGTSGHLGITYNPYDKDKRYLVGGSSCGSAAAVASNIVPFSIGSDTGDSVRKPAHNVGLVGYKPTWGLISRYGLFPFAPSLDHVGYFTRSVYDAACLLSVLAGHDEHDMTSSYKEVIDYALDIEKENTDVKVVVIKNIYDEIVNPAIKDSFDKLVNDLTNKGYKVDFIDLDNEILSAIYPTYIILSCCEATSNNANLDGIKFGPRFEGDTYQEVMKKARTDGFSELIKRRFVIGSYSLLKENQKELYLRAKKARHLIVDTFNKVFDNYDFILCPASKDIAPLVNNASDALRKEYKVIDDYLAFSNFGGYPSITIPLGIDNVNNNMPYGINISARPFNDKELLNFSLSLENITKLKNLSIKGVNK